MTDAADRLQALFSEILEEADTNPAFAERLERALGAAQPLGAEGPARRARRHGRRPPGVLDPFLVHARGGEEDLRDALAQLDIEQLKDIVAEHGMDTSKLALKWKTPGRVIDLIVTTVAARARKGHAFTLEQHRERLEAADAEPGRRSGSQRAPSSATAHGPVDDE